MCEERSDGDRMLDWLPRPSIWDWFGPDVDSGFHQRPLVAASYCSTTLAAMRPRSLTAKP
jgi:hypothetical protein